MFNESFQMVILPSPLASHFSSLLWHLTSKPFVYFAICDADIDDSEALSFLNQLKSGFEDVSGSGSILVQDNFAPSCLQVQFDSIIRKVMASDLPNLPAASRNLSFGASKGKKMVLTPLLGKNPSEGLKKKRRFSGEVNGDVCKDVTAMKKKVDVCDDAMAAGLEIFHCQHKRVVFCIRVTAKRPSKFGGGMLGLF